MGQFFASYGMFLLQTATVILLVVFGVMLIIGAARKNQDQDSLRIEHINEQIESRGRDVRRALLGKRDAKKLLKQQNREQKEQRKKEKNEPAPKKPRVFVIDFKGDIHASATASLREEVTAIIDVVEPGDGVLLRLENAGGTVHEHGLAASQLLRLRARGIPITVAVDKVAASGGYLMACVADRIVAAPFAIIGSIGVLLQMPNFHRLLEEKGIDFEQITAGKFKRTLTVFGQNTDEGREKMQEELAEVHDLFKRQVKELRPSVDLEQIATGEHWFGTRAIELKLIDEIGTSDDYLIGAAASSDVYRISYRRHRNPIERMMQGAEGLLYR